MRSPVRIALGAAGHRAAAFLFPLAIAGSASLSGCRTTDPRPVDVADRLFVRGDNEAAAMAYDDVADAAGDSNEELRARFFALAARRANANAEGLDQALADLKIFAAQASSSQWGRIAAVLVADIQQGEVLRRAVMRAGADLAVVETHLEQSRAAHSATSTRAKALEAQIQSLKDERATALRNLRDLDEQLANERTRVEALEAELDALKRIDMARQP